MAQLPNLVLFVCLINNINKIDILFPPPPRLKTFPFQELLLLRKTLFEQQMYSILMLLAC